MVNLYKGLAGMLKGLQTISEHKTDADCAKAAGLRRVMSTFDFMGTVALMLDVFEPVDVYKKQVQAREQTHAGNVSHYRACRTRLENMLADVVNCPALLLFVNEIKTSGISKE